MKFSEQWLREWVSPFNTLFTMPGISGDWSHGSLGGLSKLSDEILRQASMIGYINAFAAYTILSIAILPLVFFVRVPKRAADDSSNER